MDDLDANLLTAWNRIGERCLRDRAEAFKRSGRRLRAVMMRPPVAWCLRLRSSDTRLLHPFSDADPHDAPDLHEPHRLTLPAPAVRDLCSPVRLEHPGVPLTQAARLLGRTPDALRAWLPVRPGRTAAQKKAGAVERWENYAKPGRPLRVSYDPAQPHGHFGHDVPIVWSPSPLDPGASRGESPHAIWGTMWQGLTAKIPDHYALKVPRVPRLRTTRGRPVFRGWDWLCPGRFDLATQTHADCGRRCQTLYLPLPTWTLAHAFGVTEGFEVESPSLSPRARTSTSYSYSGSEQSSTSTKYENEYEQGREQQPLRISGTWHPGLHDPLAGRRSFACRKCWKLRGSSLLDRNGWNEFVTHLTGGLLYGHEVEKPQWMNVERKNRYAKRRKKKEVSDQQSEVTQATA